MRMLTHSFTQCSPVLVRLIKLRIAREGKHLTRDRTHLNSQCCLTPQMEVKYFLHFLTFQVFHLVKREVFLEQSSCCFGYTTYSSSSFLEPDLKITVNGSSNYTGNWWWRCKLEIPNKLPFLKEDWKFPWLKARAHIKWWPLSCDSWW